MASQNGQQRPIREVGHKSLLQSDALYQYILDTSVLPREPECMKELRQITTNDPMNIMSVFVDEGQLLNMLLKLTSAKKTMEIGVYTGYSLLATALALPNDGKEWERPKPSRRPDIFPQFSPMKTPLPTPLPVDPPEEDEEEEEEKNEEEEEDPEQPDENSRMQHGGWF